MVDCVHLSSSVAQQSLGSKTRVDPIWWCRWKGDAAKRLYSDSLNRFVRKTRRFLAQMGYKCFAGAIRWLILVVSWCMANLGSKPQYSLLHSLVPLSALNLAGAASEYVPTKPNAYWVSTFFQGFMPAPKAYYTYCT